ncbi:MAG: class I SAM-dependent methyltransferase, partial [Polyangiaceae bacterium]|nr:class I SAM-dependent methyltransferase [Polyangiaceae bacterium]
MMTDLSQQYSGANSALGQDIRYRSCNDGRVQALFCDDKKSQAFLPSRERAYPGLRGAAPRTLGFYQTFAPYCEGKVVLDIGAGTGAGLALLQGAKRRIAVDESTLATGFIGAAYEELEVLERDASKRPLPKAEVCLLVDVLGAVEEPGQLLRQVAECLAQGEMLCLAEAHASAAQELLAPMRRAFSGPQLESLLEESGFRVVEWLSTGAFLALVAQRQECPWSERLARAKAAWRIERRTEALALLQEMPAIPGGYREILWLRTRALWLTEVGEVDRGLALLLEAQQLAPNDAQVLENLAELLAFARAR